MKFKNLTKSALFFHKQRREFLSHQCCACNKHLKLLKMGKNRRARQFDNDTFFKICVCNKFKIDEHKKLLIFRSSLILFHVLHFSCGENDICKIQKISICCILHMRNRQMK